MFSPGDETSGSLYAHIRYAVVVILSIITIAFLLLDRFYPKDSIDTQTLNRMTQVVNQMQDISNNFRDNTALMAQTNKELTEQLSKRGGDNAELYQQMLNRYDDGDSSRLRPPSNSK